MFEGIFSKVFFLINRNKHKLSENLESFGYDMGVICLLSCEHTQFYEHWYVPIFSMPVTYKSNGNSPKNNTITFAGNCVVESPHNTNRPIF